MNKHLRINAVFRKLHILFVVVLMCFGLTMANSIKADETTHSLTIKKEVVENDLVDPDEEFKFKVKVWKEEETSETKPFYTLSNIYIKGSTAWYTWWDVDEVASSLNEDDFTILKMNDDISTELVYGMSVNSRYLEDDVIFKYFSWDTEHAYNGEPITIHLIQITYIENEVEKVDYYDCEISEKTITNNETKYLDLSTYECVDNGDGTYTFTTTAGVDIVISEIPEGYQYEIEEIDIPTDYELINHINDSGNLTEDIESTFTNRFKTKAVNLIKYWDDNSSETRPDDINGYIKYYFNETLVTRYTTEEPNAWQKGDNKWTAMFIVPESVKLLDYGEEDVPDGYVLTKLTTLSRNTRALPSEEAGGVVPSSIQETVEMKNTKVQDLIIKKTTVDNIAGEFEFRIKATRIETNEIKQFDALITTNSYAESGTLEKYGFVYTYGEGVAFDSGPYTGRLVLDGQEYEIRTVTEDDRVMGIDNDNTTLVTLDRFTDYGYEYGALYYITPYSSQTGVDGEILSDHFLILENMKDKTLSVYLNQTTTTTIDLSSQLGQPDDEGYYHFTLNNDGVLTIPDLPVGSEYVIEELSKDGWKLAYSVYEEGTINNSDIYAIFQNVPLYNFVVEKEVEGNDTDKLKEFTFTIQIKEKPYGCLAEGTKVLTTDGYKEIQNIKIGDTLLPEISKGQDNVVKDILTDVQPVYEITTEKGYYFKASPSHVIAVLKDGRITDVKVEELSVGDTLVNTENDSVTITKLEYNEKLHTVYNLNTTGDMFAITSGNILSYGYNSVPIDNKNGGLRAPEVYLKGPKFKTIIPDVDVNLPKSRNLPNTENSGTKTMTFEEFKNAAEFNEQTGIYTYTANLSDGDSITITDVPYGSNYYVTEELPNGWKIKEVITNNEDTGSNPYQNGEFTENTNVKYVNTALHKLTVNKHAEGAGEEKFKFRLKLEGEISCFAEGTQVLTKNSLVNIEDIKIGDLLAPMEKGVDNRVLNILKGNKPVYSIFTDKGDEIQVTDSHYMTVMKDGEPVSKKVSTITTEDVLVDYDGKIVKITKIEKGTKDVPVYCLETTSNAFAVTKGQYMTLGFVSTKGPKVKGDVDVSVPKSITGPDIEYPSPDEDPSPNQDPEILKAGSVLYQSLINDTYYNKEDGYFYIEFELADGESLIVEEIPYDTEYAIEELVKEGWILVESTNTSGKITEDTISDFYNREPFTETYVSHTVEKIWDDNNNSDKLRPASITVQLYANGKAYGDTVVLTNTTSYTWKNLPEKIDDVEVVYTVKELNVPRGYISSVNEKSKDKTIITNIHKPEIPKERPVLPKTGVE